MYASMQDSFFYWFSKTSGSASALSNFECKNFCSLLANLILNLNSQIPTDIWKETGRTFVIQVMLGRISNGLDPKIGSPQYVLFDEIFTYHN